MSGAERAASGEDGQIMLLSLVYGLVTLALVLVVLAVSTVYLERKQLLALADAMAVSAADAIDADAFYTGDRGEEVDLPLTDASVRAAVRDYLDAAPAGVTGEFEGFAVSEPTGSPDGSTAEVSLTATVRPPMVPWVLTPWREGIGLHVTARAVSD